MIRFTWYELLWLFFIYSFLGWVLETAAATVKQKKFANRGLVNGPFCVIYGIAALFMTFGLQELRGVWLFLFAAIYATVIEWVAGHLIEKAFKARWWDYSKIRWNLDGYICIPASLVWGALGYLGIRWGNRFAIVVFNALPDEDPCVDSSWNTYCGYPWILFTSAWKRKESGALGSYE